MIDCLRESILYWPGRGQNPEELSDCLNIFKTNGYFVDVLPYAYDLGDNPVNPESHIYQWAHAKTQGGSKWWIGLSLGASIAHIVASILPLTSIPNRITLINPFANRAQLAQEKKFSLKGQWPLKPEDFRSSVPTVDLVVSIDDKKIPVEHANKLMMLFDGENRRFIELDADHAITCRSTQIELSDILLYGNKNGASKRYAHIISCNLY